ncbi:ABC transporter ATP-binding protein [Frigidibacter sp. MR17.24]|uniref:ABC transporter ATP-binding protein n=1 Tax=Frigidibacter sp. MR17.24 TaxID=3127345 RepID=UPI003012E083
MAFDITSGAPLGRAVRLDGLAKSYRDFHAVRPMSLEIGAGEFLSFLGPSGSGKTTTLMMLAGFERPSAGRILLGGTEITAMAPAQRGIGMVFQSYALFPHMTVAQNVAFPLRMRGIDRAAQVRRVGEMLELVGLGDLARRHPAQLSGGQQQRVALARALVFRPPVLLMDEPLSALDKYLRGRLQVEIKRIQRELGITVVFVTHDQEEAMSMSDRIVVMQEGAVAQMGPPEVLYQQPRTEFVAGFLGETNFITRPLLGTAAGRLTIDMATGPVTVAVRADAVPGAVTAGPVTVAIRPEHLGFHPDPAGIAVVREVTYVGDHRRYELALDDGTEMVARRQETEGAAPVARGARVTPDWPLSRLRLFCDGRALQ